MKTIKKFISFLMAFLLITGIMPIWNDVQEAIAATSVSSASQVSWTFSAFGQNISTSTVGYSGSATGGTVSVYSHSGKLTDEATDGLAFYYTKVPADMNFTLRAKVKVDYWQLSNGAEGFGLMAADRVATHGFNKIFWNNSYMAAATRISYYYDTTKRDVVSTGGKYINMRLGILAQEKIGATVSNLAKLEANDTTAINTYYKASKYPLETSAGEATAAGKTVYTNIIGNGTVPTNAGNVAVEGTSPQAVTEMYMSIQKNNTGYFITYESVDGKYKTIKKYYDTEALEQLDKNYVYVGFFASRYAKATFTDITFKTVAPANDTVAESQPVEKVPVKRNFHSPTVQGFAAYQFVFSANCDGKLTIKNSNGKILVSNYPIKANVRSIPLTTTLSYGQNLYRLTFTPNAGYSPGENQVMETYESIDFTRTIEYKSYGTDGGLLWVAPGAKGNGTKSSPMDIYEAVKYVRPGQSIVIKAGTYYLSDALTIPMGIDGMASKKIYMIADPEAATRPILNFQGKGTGINLRGNYWVFKGFDVTKGSNGGIRISGNHNLVENVNTYYNYNTGIQISAYSSSDPRSEWPKYNTVLNCTSYGNADEGYEDADGFAAKLTCGVGNVFDGCISHHNADDGWDLYARVTSGSIGSVTIRNSVAYSNGYLEDGTNAGNGNGFKLGGENMPGKHILENCVAYDNKTKGIDANSCPDIIVKNCISFNNGSYNVALYANNVANTDFSVDGVISYRTKNLTQAELIRPMGSQNASKIYKITNYYWNNSTKAGVNSSGGKVAANWFESLNTSLKPSRNADGTINMHGLLELTDNVPRNMQTCGLYGTRVESNNKPSEGETNTSKDDNISSENVTNSSGNVMGGENGEYVEDDSSESDGLDESFETEEGSVEDSTADKNSGTNSSSGSKENGEIADGDSKPSADSGESQGSAQEGTNGESTSNQAGMPWWGWFAIVAVLAVVGGGVVFYVKKKK